MSWQGELEGWDAGAHDDRAARSSQSQATMGMVMQARRGKPRGLAGNYSATREPVPLGQFIFSGS